MTVALMWEARAAEGRGGDLLAWARARAGELTPRPLRRETFRAPQDRVLVITWWDTAYDDPDLPELPEPGAELVTRAVHRWRFEPVGEQPSWYGVRCVFRHVSLGVYEERVTLWTAHSLDEAIEHGETEAAAYCADLDDVAYTGFAEAYAMDGAPGEGAEVFSLMRESPLPPGEYAARFFATGTERTAGH
ncbi:hypothetical protein SAMN04487983_1018103 [Streptomyces sp. yr375]|nr:hypothetical protein SAMN04487983_1018103 [Streptomyces sp. yr375]